MLRILPVFGALLVAGCGYPEDKFTEDFQQAFCQKYIDCEYGALVGWETVDDCLAAMDSGSDTGGEDTCDYDSKAAKECVADVEAMSCDDMVSGLPSSCSSVCGSSDDSGT